MRNEQSTDDFLSIDPDGLPEKLESFARDYFHEARKLVDAREEYERTKRVRDVMVTEKKDALELVEAEIDRNARNNPEDYGIEKVTETSVANAIKLQEKYQKARADLYKVKASCEEEVAKARHAMGIHQVFVDAMDALKKNLESYAYIWQATYFAQPKLRGDGRENVGKIARDRAFKPKQLDRQG